MAGDVFGTPAAPEAVEAPRRGWLAGYDKGLLWSLLELFVLTGFVVAQPLLDVTGKAPDFFIFRRADRLDILLLIGVVTVLPALYLWAFELIMSLAGERARKLLHLVIVTSLLVVLAMEVGKKLLPLRGKRLALVALVVAVALGLLYLRQAWARMWLRYLAPAPLVFAMLFATTSPSAKLLLPSASHTVSHPVASTVRRPPIVMVFFDEFPLESLLDSSGHVDARIYPNFADVAEHSVWYRNATGVSGYTPWAVPAMLTGQYPLKAKAPITAEYPDNLFTLFGRYYNLEVKETITQLCPIERCGSSGSPSGGGMKAMLTDTAKLWKDIAAPYDSAVDPASFADTQTAQDAAAGAGNQADKATDVKPSFRFKQIGHTDEPGRWTEFLDSIQASDPQPTLYFLHVLMPHVPWHYLPSGTQYPYRNFNGKGMRDNKDWGPGIMDENHERHLLQVAYTDKLIGQLLQRLKEQGLYDKSLLLMTADHGEGFTVGNKTRSLGDRNAHSLMWVPLFIKAPNQTKGRIDDRNWEHVDLLPTLADMVGITIPWKVDGFSEAGPPRRQRTDKYWYGIPGHRLVRDGPAAFPTTLHGVTDTLVRGHQEGERGLYRYGATADWIYRSPSEVGEVTGGGGLTAQVTHWDDAWTSIDPGSGQVPAFVFGQMTSGPPPRDAKLAVAINGQIGGVNAFFYDSPGGEVDKFAAVVPDFLFRKGPGHPQVQLYLVQRSGGRVQFHPIAITG